MGTIRLRRNANMKLNHQEHEAREDKHKIHDFIASS
jgi:hypothetical protein